MFFFFCAQVYLQSQCTISFLTEEHFTYFAAKSQKIFLLFFTLKNSLVEPESRVPYAISVCLARSSALSMGETILSTVRKAARFAVQEEMMIKVKNHQTPPTIRPERDLSRQEKNLSSWVTCGEKANAKVCNVYRQCHCKSTSLAKTVY